MNDFNKEYRTRLSKNGLITLAIAAVLLAVLLAINLLVSALPANIRSIDMTENKMYSLSDQTKREIAKTDTAVTVYLFCRGGEAALADNAFHLDAFLDNLAAVSGKITYRLVDPLTDTATLSELGLETVDNLSVTVKSALRSRSIPSSDFFAYYVDGVGKVNENNALYYYYYYGLTPSYVFDGEALLLSAIRYVCDPNPPTVYALSGHSETALSETLLKQLDTANFNTASITLTNAGLPSDCDMLIINAPQSDLAAAEVETILSYIKKGGTVMLITTPDSATFTNLSVIVEAMGMTAEQGIVVETNSSYYYNAQAPYYLIPIKESHSATQTGSNVMLPFAHGIRFAEPLPEGISASPLLSTSSAAYLLDIDAETLAKPEDTELRSFCVGGVSQNAVGGKLIWFPSNGLTNDSGNQAVNGGNYAFLVKCAEWVCGSEVTTATAPLPLSTPRLSVTTSTAGLLALIIIFLIPLGFIGYGLFFVIRRRRK